MHLTQKAMPMTQAAPDASIPSGSSASSSAPWPRSATSATPTAAAVPAGARRSAARSRAPACRASHAGWSGARRGCASQRRRLAFLVRRAREAGVPWPRAFVGGGLRWWSRSLARCRHAAPDGPRPAPAAMAESLERAESLLVARRIGAGARGVAAAAVAHPETARVRYLFGNLDYAQGERERALGDYRDAISLDAGYASDAVLRANVRALLDRRAKGPPPWRCSPTTSASPRCPISSPAPRPAATSARAAAPPKPPSSSAARSSSPTRASRPTTRRRRRARASCAPAVAARSAKRPRSSSSRTGDKRYLDSLRAARDRRGGFLGLEQINGCMRRDLDAAIRKLEADK